MSYKDKDRQREYQRKWVRHKRKGSTAINRENVEPSVEPSVRPVVEMLDKIIINGIDMKTVFNMGEPSEPIPLKPEPQSYNPMMVGYVPPQD